MASRARQPNVPAGTFGSDQPERSGTPDQPDPPRQEASEASVRSALRPPPPPGHDGEDEITPLRLSDVEPVELPPLKNQEPPQPGLPSGRFDKGEHPLRGQSDEEFALELEDLVASFDLPPIPPPHIPEMPPASSEAPILPPPTARQTDVARRTEPAQPGAKAPAASKPVPPPPLPNRGKAERTGDAADGEGQRGAFYWAPVILGTLLLIGAGLFALNQLDRGPAAPVAGGVTSAASPASAPAVEPQEPAAVDPAEGSPTLAGDAVAPASGEQATTTTDESEQGGASGDGTSNGAATPAKVAGKAGQRAARTARRAPRKRPAQEGPQTTDLPEAPSRADIVRGFSSVGAAVKACADGMSGVAQVTATIAGSGRVRHAVVTGSFHGTPQGSCVARAVRKAKFPPFQTESLKVDFPFSL